MAQLDSTRRLALLALLGSFLLGIPGSAQEPPWDPGSTTLVVLPDTERYSDDLPQHFHAQTTWIAAARERRNIAGVVHLGDITQHNAPAEWQVARLAFDRLEGRIPLVLVPGNHDYDDNAPQRATCRLTGTFPPDELFGTDATGGVFEAGRSENGFRLLRIGTQDWIILALEMGPREPVVAWANEVLAAHPDRLAMIVTHAYLFRGDVRYDHRRGSQRASPHSWGNDGEELWQKLVRRHANVRIVLSGHVSSGGLGYLRSEGDYGNDVHQLMVDYESLRGGGMGFLRLLEFLPDGRSVQVRTYSPVLAESRSSSREDFRFELRGSTRERPVRAEDAAARPLARAPLHRWSFDETDREATELRDTLGGSHATLRPEGSASHVDGQGILELVGDGFVELPPGLLAGHDALSFEVWFTPTAERYRWHSVVRFGDADDWLTYVFRTLEVHRAEIAVARHNEDVQRRVPLLPETLRHAVVTYEPTATETAEARLSLFVDGELLGWIDTSLRLEDIADSGHRIGPFAGSFDELRIHGRALSEAEIRGSRDAGPDEVVVAEDTAAIPIVFDTDMDTDCDDAGALAMLHELAHRGEVRILATVVVSHYPYSAPCVEAINRYYGHAGLPIGSPKGPGATTSRGSRYARTVASESATRLATNADAPPATAVYRRVLAAQPDHSVVLVTVGYLTNLRDLLRSPPDTLSPLTGRELVARKVRRWVCMGGRYPENLDPRPNGNFKPDPDSALEAIRDWPGEIWFSGDGRDVPTGGPLRTRMPPEHPVRRCYDLYLGDRPTRPSWDQVALLCAVRPRAPFWRTREQGHNHLFANGTNQWRDEPDDARHRLVEIAPGAQAEVAALIDALMAPERDAARGR